MKKMLLFIMAVAAVTASTLPVFAQEEGYPPNFTVESGAVYLYNLDTEEVIYSKNAHEPMYPASLTKIMTCILALENTPDPATEIITYPQYVQDYLYDYQYIKGNGIVSNAELMAGEQLPMEDALYALMLPSANEVAMTIAHHIGGSQEAFAAMMNKRARELGANNTSFVNPNGLFDPKHVTTAYDMAQLARHAMSLPGFMDVVTTSSYTCPPTNKHENLVWTSTNRMMMQNSEYYYAPLKGIKTGTLPESGRCFVSTATKDGFTYLLVIMGAPYLDESGKALPQQMAFVETKRFYEWAFENFRVKTLVDKGKHVGDIQLNLNLDQDRLRLMTAERVTALLHRDIEASNVTFDTQIPESWNAPVKKGDEIGEVALMLSGEEVGRVKLLAAESVEASTVLVALEKVKSVTRSFWFKFTVILIVLLIVSYIALTIVRNRNRRRRGYKPRRRI